MMEHAVIAYLPLSDGGFGTWEERAALLSTANAVGRAISDHEAGMFDGEEFGGGRCVFYMYGPDADALFAAIEPVLRASPLARGIRIVKRYGDADSNAPEVTIEL